MKIKILYEDNHVIAVIKPAGMLVQGDDTGDPSLLLAVKKYLKDKYHKPGNVFLGLVHRLDRPVTGVVILAKTSKGASRLCEQFREHSIQKIYHALVCGHMPQKKGTLISYLQKNRNKNQTSVHARPDTGRQRAELNYEVLQSNKNLSLIKIILKTGRSHQIRAQLSSVGCPILGDIKYGALKPLPDGIIALTATSLTFKLPTKNQSQTVSMELPTAWSAYFPPIN